MRTWLTVVACLAVAGCESAPREVVTTDVAPASPATPLSATPVLPSPSSSSAPAASALAGVNDSVPSAHHCEGSPVQCGQNAAPPTPQPAVGGQLYGAALDQAIAPTPLTELMSRPSVYATKVVQTSGTIGRVCQNRGCWMELRSESSAGVVRVPMAGHAFFVPSDSSGRAATIQGVVSVREGTENPVRIDATSVLIADARL